MRDMSEHRTAHGHGANKCTLCDHAKLTFTEIRHSWGQLRRAGVSEELAKELSPLCDKCVHEFIRGLRDGE
jgi:hypothetical protein